MAAKSSVQLLAQTLRTLPPPASLLSGLHIGHSLAPDNIVFFQHTDAAALRPAGVTHNYHHRFELVVVLEKAGPICIGRFTYALEPGECAVIFPNQFHHYMDVAAGPMDWFFITFELPRNDGISALRDAPRVLGERGLSLLRSIVREYVEPRDHHPDALEISYLLSRLLLHLVEAPKIAEERQDIHRRDSACDAILEGINRYVRQHLDRPVKLGDLAGALGYSVSHLRAVFRDRLGVSLGKYMRESRLAEAARLLQQSELSIAEISARCGFALSIAFSRAFRNAYGRSPRAYRQLVQESAAPPAAK
jgi:AraC-like DNA-binding protein